MSNLVKNNNNEFVFNNTNNRLTFTDQKNTVTLDTENTFVDGDIVLNTLVTKAVLNMTSNDTDHKTFQIQVPNGSSSNNITFTFEVDNNGNVIVS